MGGGRESQRMNLLPWKFRGAPRCSAHQKPGEDPGPVEGGVEGAGRVPWDFCPRLRLEAETRVPGELENGSRCLLHTLVSMQMEMQLRCIDFQT